MVGPAWDVQERLAFDDGDGIGAGCAPSCDASIRWQWFRISVVSRCGTV